MNLVKKFFSKSANYDQLNTLIRELSKVHRHQAREGLDPVPEVLDPDIFILRMLIVVVIGDRD